jgi:glycosyltransferase involved in cell wall biosynthesis
MINVLHLRDTDRVCGPGKTIIETACATDRRFFTQKVGLFLPSGDARNEYYEAALRRGVEIVELRSASRFDARLVRTIIRAIKAHNIHLVHSHEYKGDILAYLVSRIHRIPIMSTIHGWIVNNVKARIYIGMGRRVLPRFDRVVAVSDETRARVLGCGVPPDRLAVIHNAIVTEHYESEAHPRGVFRARFGIPADAYVVGYIGRLNPEKGQSLLLNAAARIAASRPRPWLAFVGDGPDRAALEREAAALGLSDRVVFTGHLSDVRPVYRDLDVLALTSYTEGFPNVLLESLCMGTPVIATDVGGVRELIQDGDTGVLVPPGSAAAIATGLVKLMDQREWAKALAVRGKQLVFERYRFLDRVRREEALYREILESWKR